MSDEEGTRRCPRSSKNFRNRSRTSVDFIVVMRAFHDLRNSSGREAPPHERAPDPLPPPLPRGSSTRGPELRKRAFEGLFFPRRVGLRQRRSDRLRREAASRELPLDSDTPVARALGADHGPRRPEIIEETPAREAVERLLRRGFRKAAPFEVGGQFRAPARANRQETQRPVISRRRGIGMPCPGDPAGRGRYRL